MGCVVGDNEIVGVKTLAVQASVRYPIVSAYEFEFLKKESGVTDYLRPCTLYMIVQRPLMVINDLRASGGVIEFSIDDDTDSSPLRCSIDLYAAKILDRDADDDYFLHAEFFKNNGESVPPLNEVAGFKVLGGDSKFRYWVTAERFLYHVIKGTSGFAVSGDIESYMDYEVHYIGKAFDQGIWKRLTGHEKLQRILTMEPSRNARSLGAPFEVSLLMLELVGATEAVFAPYMGFPIFENPKFHVLDSADSMQKFLEPWVDGPTLELTNEAEALLISTMKPSYNTILFKEYPDIERGAQSLGYTECILSVQLMPAKLRTNHFSMPIMGLGSSSPVD